MKRVLSKSRFRVAWRIAAGCVASRAQIRSTSSAGAIVLTALSPEEQRADRSFQTDARAEPAHPDVGVASDASRDLRQEAEDQPVELLRPLHARDVGGVRDPLEPRVRDLAG